MELWLELYYLYGSTGNPNKKKTFFFRLNLGNPNKKFRKSKQKKIDLSYF
jgi:hypothetical protein